MPARNQTPGSFAGAVVFSNIPGHANQSPVLQGDVLVVPKQRPREVIQDVHSEVPYFKEKSLPPHFRVTMLTTDSLPWLIDVIGANARIEFTNGRIFTASGVTIAVDQVEKNVVQGNTNELMFVCTSLTEA
jgi:hypothetical protein